MSVSSSVNNQKALLFLKNFGEVNQFTIKDLPNSLESLVKPFIDKSLGNTTHVFEEFIKDKEQQEAFLQNNRSTEQQWRMIFAISKDVPQSSLEDIFRAAIQAAPASSKEDAQQIYTRLIEKPETDLSQIYIQRYTAEFLTWVQNEIYELPCDSILLLLKIWRNFDQSIDQAWKALLSLPGLSSSHRGELIVFQTKQNFMYKNHKTLQTIKLESVPALEKPNIPGSTRTSRKYLNQYVLWINALNVFLGEVALSYGFGIVGFKEDSWEYQLLYTPRETSSKILIWRAKSIFPLYQKKLKPFIEFFDEKIEPLKKAKQKISELEYLLKQIQEGIPIYGSSNVKGIEKVSEEEIKIDKTSKLISEEQIKTYLENWKETEKSLQIDLAKPIGFRDDISHIEYLMKELHDSFQVKKSRQEITEGQIALIEKNQKELIQAEYEYISSQKKVCTAPIKESDSDSEIREESSSSDSESDIAASHTLTLVKLSFTELDAFLKNGGQVNGLLSKSIDGTLKQLKTHLAKIQAPISDELNIVRKEKIKEIHTQLVIATAALELIIQAIKDQRFDQVLLGFRSCLVHCHFAIEQMLSLKLLVKNKEVTNTHDLIELAEKAQIDRLEEQREFLKDIGIHLWFCYPEDYQFFHPEESSHPKPFIFLQKLFQFYREEEKLDIAILKEAVQLCFRMYTQTIEFITESSSFPAEDPNEFLKKVEKVQEQIIWKEIEVGNFKKAFSRNKTSISRKCSQSLDLLKSVNTLENIQNFKELLLPINTIKGYLELMEISLRIPQKSHSLQEFIQVETMVNMDKLFKHLFRIVILIQTGENNHSHNLSALLQLTGNFYEKGLITEKDKFDLKELNISITHHYLHRNSNSVLKRNYKHIWDLAYRLNLLSAKDFILISKRYKISYPGLQLEKGKIFKRLDIAFKLFIKLLKPVITEIEQLNDLS